MGKTLRDPLTKIDKNKKNTNEHNKRVPLRTT